MSDALRDLVPFVKFKKRKKRFLNCANGTKSRKVFHMFNVSI